MCGDGANDAPALRQAQIGIAVSTATDVAKSAAGVVLTEAGLGGIVAAVKEGRVTFQRILTYTLNSVMKKILQILLLAVGLVMIIQNDRGMQRLIGSGFELGADASAAAGPVGRHASADTNWKLDTEILTYSRARGAFAGVTLNGASIRRDDDSTDAIYGVDVSTRRILRGEVAVPAAAAAFLNAVRDAKAQSIASN